MNAGIIYFSIILCNIYILYNENDDEQSKQKDCLFNVIAICFMETKLCSSSKDSV